METLADRIERHEGRRYKIYVDSRGNRTIGVGCNLEYGLDDDEITHIRDNRIRKASVALMHGAPWSGALGLRREVLVEMVFNLGILRFLQFKKMLAAAEAGDFETAADEMLDSDWARDVGERATELVAIMRTGAAAK